jgi:transcription elongation factor GreA
MFAKKHSECGDQQENAEQVENKMKPLYQSDTGQDHDSAHDQGADNSPHQRTMLCHWWHAKVSKNQHKNEDVIDAQRIFDEVSSEKIEAGLRSFNVPNEPIKSKRYQHPRYAPLAGRTHAQFPPAALEADEIDRYRDEDADVKSDPKPNAGCHGALAFHGRRSTAIVNALNQSFLSPSKVFIVVCAIRMEPDLEKLVESGKLTATGAEQLEKLKPGTFCLHKSWGFGCVTEWNLLLNQVVIDFAGKKSHPMQVQYAAANLTPLPPEHFLVRKASDLMSIKTLARQEPVAVVRNILESRGSYATVGQISEWLIGDVFTEAEWKRWWESTKKSLKASGAFSVPAKKTESVQLRREGVSHTDELVATFNKARQPKEQIAALEQIIKFHQQFKDPEKQLQPMVGSIENVAARNQKMHPELAFELILARDDLLERISQLHTTHIGLTLSKLILDEQKRLMSILPKLPAAKEKRVLQALPAVLGPRWVERALQLMQGSHGRMIAQIARVFSEVGQHAEVKTMLERSIREHSATSEMLVWLCNERERWRQLINPELLGAILGALEREQHNVQGRGSKLQRVLVDDRQLVGDMFANGDIGVARDYMRRLQVSPLFDELTKRSLLGRIIKVYPELESMITGAETQEKTAPLIVSWSSLERRKAEYEQLVKTKIPENSKEIAIARSYGDLSENFEFKAAKQMQSVLMRRKAELEQMLHNARGTSFEKVDTSRVSIGTVVRLRDSDSKKEETYTILGAWDGDPDRHIISYQTAIGQALLGHKLGEVVSLNSDHGAAQFAIVSIEAAPPDKTEQAATLSKAAAIEPVIAE